MSILKIRKVSALPGTLEASTMYMVAGAGDLMDIYVSASDGLSAKHIISQSEIQSMISQALGGFNTVQVVADITARDALAPTTNVQVLVLDATDDTSVTTGGATYIYDINTTTWYKVSEFESLDLVINWDNIQGRPTSTPAQIDLAVSNSHTHANKSLLDGLSDVSGHLYHAGQPVRPYLEEEAW